MTIEGPGAMDIHEIMATLPHRPPMLLIDRVISCEPGKGLRAIKNVTINEPFFAGHFPGFPVWPGVMVIEALAQAAALLAHRTAGTRANGDSLLFFAGIDNARFRRQVVPGDQLTLEVEVVRIVRGIGKFTARAKVGDEIACEAELMAALRATGLVSASASDSESNAGSAAANAGSGAAVNEESGPAPNAGPGPESCPDS